MKKILITILISLFLASAAWAIQFTWDALVSATGYIVYYNDGTNNYNKNVGAEFICDSQDDLQMVPGTNYTVHVTAYNDYGESGPSNSIQYTENAYIPPEDVLPTAGSVPNAVLNLNAL
jgi:hypothetical protein